MITFEELNFRPPQGDVLRYVYRYVDALQRRRQTLKTPDRATTQRHVKCLLDNFQRYPEDAKRLEHLVDRLRRGGETAAARLDGRRARLDLHPGRVARAGTA